jgi:antitoxin Phd
LINRAVYRGERILFERRGKEVAALISVEDLRLLERLIADQEDRIDATAAKAALSEPGVIPYETVRKELAL